MSNDLVQTENEGSVITSPNIGDSAPKETEVAEASTEAKAEPAPDADKSEEAKEEKPARKSRSQERIEQLARALAAEKRDKQQRLARANQEIGRLRAEAQPREADFDDPTDYTVAKLERKVRETAAEQRLSDVRTETEELGRKRQEVWAERVAEASEKMPDFTEVFHDKVPVSPVMAELIVESDVGTELAYHLGKNLSLANRIYQMSPTEAAREIGRLEARLSLPQPKTVSTAPKPVSTVGGQAQATGKSLDSMDYDAYKAARMADIKKRRGY